MLASALLPFLALVILVLFVAGLLALLGITRIWRIKHLVQMDNCPRFYDLSVLKLKPAVCKQALKAQLVNLRNKNRSALNKTYDEVFNKNEGKNMLLMNEETNAGVSGTVLDMEEI